ncbi:MAG TPA: uroporphyrinogen-III synthase, partial [Candidatus Binataceae bacterium]|nr:uroporphyrinogen-III synthase [Candidatus Binataceae bacterium]
VAPAPLDARHFVPCGGQGALCIEALAGRPAGGADEVEAALAALEDRRARLETTAERAFLAALGASCVSPVGAFAQLDVATLAIRALVFSLDGARHLSDEMSAEVGDGAAAAALGARLAARMLAGGARELIGDVTPPAAAARAGAAGGVAADASAPSVATALRGRRVVITRASAAGGAFAVGLRALGAEVVEFPTIELVAPDSYAVVDAAIARLASFDWVIFTSASGVERMIERMETRGVASRALGGPKLGAIGPATAARLVAHALAVAAMPTEFRAEAIVEAIGARRIRGARILIARAQVAREVLPEMLAAAGAREVVVAPVYKTVTPANAPVARVRKMIAARTIDLVAFTSSSTVTNFCELIGADAARGLTAAAIGPITAESARAAGMEVAVQPTEYTVSALIAAIHDFFTARETP